MAEKGSKYRQEIQQVGYDRSVPCIEMRIFLPLHGRRCLASPDPAECLLEDSEMSMLFWPVNTLDQVRMCHKYDDVYDMR